MSTQDTFKKAVAHYCDGLTVNVGCLGAQCEHADGDDNHQCEASFSWSQCDSCGSTLGGDRYPATGVYTDDNDTLQVIEFNICIDCAMYHANGELPGNWEN